MTQKLPLHRAAAAIAGGEGHAAALRAQDYSAQRYRYWNVTASGIGGALATACEQGMQEFGIAPARSRWIVLAARPEAPAETPAVASVAPAPVPMAPAPVSMAPAPVSMAAAPAPRAAVPTPAPAALAPAARVAAPTPAGWPAGRLGELLTLVNDVRQKGHNCSGLRQAPVPPLIYDTRLALAAQLHANAMTSQGFADHVNPKTRSTPQTRAAAEGWSGEVGENMYTGAQSAQEALNWWLGSAVHCTNVMNPYWTHFGAGLALSSDKAPDGPYWVLDFGRAGRR